METLQSAWLYRGFQRKVRIGIMHWTIRANGGDVWDIRKAIASQRPDLSMKEIKAAVDRWWDAGMDEFEGSASQGRTFHFML
jgi:hypothetical protein